MICDVLIPLLSECFPGSSLVSEEEGRPCLTFPAKHPDVGDVQVFDDGDEITVYAGKFTHGHFSNYDNISSREKEQMIAEAVADFLSKLFSDRVILWSYMNCCGWQVIDPESPGRTKHPNEHVWSGPLTSDSAKR